MRKHLRFVLCWSLFFGACGSGGIPDASLSTTSVTLGNAVVGSTSDPAQVTLTNSGTATLYIAGIDVSANFAETSQCGSALRAKAACDIDITFTPSVAGDAAGTLSINDNDSGSPQTISLSGSGLSLGSSCSAKGQVCGLHPCCSGSCVAAGNRAYCQ